MAYNGKNRFKRIIDIQNIVKEYQAIGLNNTQIYERHIEPVYRISKRTFDEFLGVPAQRELKKILDIEKQQPKLFNDEDLQS